MKYNPANMPIAQGGDYRPHYRKDEVDAHIVYLGALIDAQAVTIHLLRAQKTELELRMYLNFKAWSDSIEKAKTP